jgi:RNA polymerase sigma-70 factor (ECF subfamily)
MATTDSSLVIETLNGDREAFGMLVERYERQIFNLAFRICGDYEDAMDVTQTVFVKAFERLRTFDPSRKFFSWLYRMGVNESLNQVKRQSRIVRVEFDPPSRSPGPEQQVIREQADGLVQSALRRLGEDYRVVIILRHFVDLSYSQIADVLAIPEKTVKSRLYSARQRMKELLTEAGL